MAKFTKTEISRTLEVTSGALPSGMAKAFEAQAKGEKMVLGSTEALVKAFISNGWDFSHTVSPCKNDGVTPKEKDEQNSALTVEQYGELVASRAKGLGKLALYKTNPEFLALQYNQAQKGVKLAITAHAGAKGQKAKATTKAALAKAECARDDWKAKKDERTALILQTGSKLKDFRKALARGLFRDQRTFLLNDGKDAEQANIGAATYVDSLQKRANVSVKYGQEKFLPSMNAKPTDAQVGEAITKAIAKAISELNKLPDSNEVKEVLAKLEALREPKH